MLRKKAEKPVPKLFGLRPVRKPPKFMDQVKRTLVKWFAKVPPAKHVARVSTRVTNAYKTELAGLFATVLLAKKTFDSTRQVDLPFPEKYLDGAAPIDEAARAELMVYAEALQKFHEQCEDSSSPLGYAIAQGVDVWMASVYGLAIPELTPDVRRMWEQLVKGEEGIDEAFKMVIRREPSDLDREYFKYRPKALIG